MKYSFKRLSAILISLLMIFEWVPPIAVSAFAEIVSGEITTYVSAPVEDGAADYVVAVGETVTTGNLEGTGNNQIKRLTRAPSQAVPGGLSRRCGAEAAAPAGGGSPSPA